MADFWLHTIVSHFLKARSEPRRRPNCSATAPRNLTREHRAGPRSSHHKSIAPHGSLNRIEAAYPLPQPALRCDRRSQLSRNRTPVRTHVLHSLPHGYGECDLGAIADGANPPAWDALGTTEQTSGQHQSRGLVDAEPVTLEELDPAHNRTEGRVDLVYLNSLAVAAGEKVTL